MTDQTRCQVFGIAGCQLRERNRCIDVVERLHAAASANDPLTDLNAIRYVRTHYAEIRIPHSPQELSLQLGNGLVDLSQTVRRIWEIAILRVPRPVAFEKTD